MRLSPFATACALLAILPVALPAQELIPGFAAARPDSTVTALVARLELPRYKATIKGLTQFGDRRQGTDRNRAAVDWIEAQLKSYGCTNTERIKYDITRRQVPLPAGETAPAAGRGGAVAGRGTTAGRGAGRGGAPGLRNPVKGTRARTGVNMDPMLQPDTAIRREDAQPDTPGEREEVYCTKIGTTHPEEMYIVSGHMDGHGYGQAANDDGSGTAIVMELARIFSSPDVKTDRSIRFALWNNEETGLDGAKAYIAQRKDLQGKESPAGSGKYPEPKWLGVIQHDMMMWDHGMPGPDGKVSPEQRREADVNVEFAGTSQFAADAAKLAWFFRQANDKYATDYPAAVGDRMSNTDSDPFKDLVPALSMRENERLSQIGTGWDPNWHQPSDVYTTYSDKDFMLGLNSAQTTLSAIAVLTGARILK
ncbi:MAG TPA: M20/M25/M40 family metallo-hydrolase [Gemmatimonadales bacterium]